MRQDFLAIYFLQARGISRLGSYRMWRSANTATSAKALYDLKCCKPWNVLTTTVNRASLMLGNTKERVISCISLSLAFLHAPKTGGQSGYSIERRRLSHALMLIDKAALSSSQPTFGTQRGGRFLGHWAKAIVGRRAASAASIPLMSVSNDLTSHCSTHSDSLTLRLPLMISRTLQGLFRKQKIFFAWHGTTRLSAVPD